VRRSTARRRRGTRLRPYGGESARAPLMQHEEVLILVERHRLMATRIGWVDAHLLGSALLAGARLWPLDQSLASVARKLGVAANFRTPDEH
jgi:hypothetical protein